MAGSNAEERRQAAKEASRRQIQKAQDRQVALDLAQEARDNEVDGALQIAEAKEAGAASATFLDGGGLEVTEESGEVNAVGRGDVPIIPSIQGFDEALEAAESIQEDGTLDGVEYPNGAVIHIDAEGVVTGINPLDVVPIEADGTDAERFMAAMDVADAKMKASGLDIERLLDAIGDSIAADEAAEFDGATDDMGVVGEEE